MNYSTNEGMNITMQRMRGEEFK